MSLTSDNDRRYVELWRAVIWQQVLDICCNNTDQKYGWYKKARIKIQKNAEAWFSSDSCKLVCDFAEINYQSLTDFIKKILL